MKFRLWGVLLGSFLPAYGLHAEDLSIAFWNVENLFDAFPNKATPEEDVYLPQEVAEKLQKDAEILRLLDADVVGLCEVENRDLLRRLVEKHLQGKGYRHHVLIRSASTRGIHCALLSRRPFLAYSASVPDFDREILVARFTEQGEPFYVLVCHWKSRFGGGEDVRMNCARTVMRIIQRDIPAYEGRRVPVVVIGDLNDEDHDASVKHLEAQGLVNTLKQLPLHERWTIPYYNARTRKMQYQGFDHVLVTPDVAEGRGLLKLKRAEVVRPKQMIVVRKIAFYDRIYLEDDYDDKIGYSDHLPVRCTVTLQPSEP